MLDAPNIIQSSRPFTLYDSLVKSSPVYIIIVESPAKIPIIEHALIHFNVRCVATKGHIRSISHLRDIQITNGQLDIQWTNDVYKKEQIIDPLAQYIHTHPVHVVLATDNDREGESIAWHICECIGISSTHTPRIRLSAIVPNILQSELSRIQQKQFTPHDYIHINQVWSQQTRQMIDLFIGIRTTRIMRKYIERSLTEVKPPKQQTAVQRALNITAPREYKTKGPPPLSLGRCQTPALSIIDETIHKYETFPIDTLNVCYHATGIFTRAGITFTSNNIITKKQIMFHKEHGHTYNMAVSPVTVVTEPPPKPLNTITMICEATIALRISVHVLMQSAQELYQQGFITYIRTDSLCYSKAFWDEIIPYCETMKYTRLTPDMSYYMERLQTSGETHESIRPVSFNTSSMKVDGNINRRVYKWIWTRALESILAPAQYKVYTYTVKCQTHAHSQHDGHEHDCPIYTHIARVPLEFGWKVVQSTVLQRQRETAAVKQIVAQCSLIVTPPPSFGNTNTNTDTREYSVWRYIHCVSQCFTPFIHAIQTPVVPYTESELLKTLSNYGIGRPSTYAHIISTLLAREYICIQPLIPKITKLENEYEISGSIFNEKAPPYNTTQTDISSISRICAWPPEEIRKYLHITPIGKKVARFARTAYNEIFSTEFTTSMERVLDNVHDMNTSISAINVLMNVLVPNTTTISQITQK